MSLKRITTWTLKEYLTPLSAVSVIVAVPALTATMWSMPNSVSSRVTVTTLGFELLNDTVSYDAVAGKISNGMSFSWKELCAKYESFCSTMLLVTESK